MTRITIIDKTNVERAYGFMGTIAVIDHPTHGRLLIEDGFGGQSELRGGMVRWDHGSVYKLQLGDTIESLDSEGWSDGMTLLQAVRACCDPSRPMLAVAGITAESIAKQAGL